MSIHTLALVLSFQEDIMILNYLAVDSHSSVVLYIISPLFSQRAAGKKIQDLFLQVSTTQIMDRISCNLVIDIDGRRNHMPINRLVMQIINLESSKIVGLVQNRDPDCLFHTDGLWFDQTTSVSEAQLHLLRTNNYNWSGRRKCWKADTRKQGSLVISQIHQSSINHWGAFYIAESRQADRPRTTPWKFLPERISDSRRSITPASAIIMSGRHQLSWRGKWELRYLSAEKEKLRWELPTYEPTNFQRPVLYFAGNKVRKEKNLTCRFVANLSSSIDTWRQIRIELCSYHGKYGCCSGARGRKRIWYPSHKSLVVDMSEGNVPSFIIF